MKIDKKLKNILMILFIIILILIVMFFMMINGYVIPTKLEAEKYEIKGVDVSEYQGEIDWNKIKDQGISFAFIKATEGKEGKDNYFDSNFQKLKEMDILIGCYHFFSFESSGEEQATNYINVVGNIENDESLILPIIDVEYYNYYKKAKPNKERILQELQKMLDKLEKTYKIKPMIYTTEEFYNDYIQNSFLNYDIWIRNILIKPKLENREWKFWQYTGRGRLEGYEGSEKFIDLNVFNGSKEEFDKFIQSKKQEKKTKFDKEERIRIEKEENTITSVYRALVTNIEGNTYTIETEENEELKFVLNNTDINYEIYNKRTNEKLGVSDINNIKVNDKIDIEKIYIRQGEIIFIPDTKIYLIKNIHGDELKKELLQNEISLDLESIEKSGSNYRLKGIIRDFYYTNDYSLAESFETEVIVNNNTTILGIKGKTEEQIKQLKKFEIFITLDKEQLEKGKLIATNIEGMGC